MLDCPACHCRSVVQAQHAKSFRVTFMSSPPQFCNPEAAEPHPNKVLHLVRLSTHPRNVFRHPPCALHPHPAQGGVPRCKSNSGANSEVGVLTKWQGVSSTPSSSLPPMPTRILPNIPPGTRQAWILGWTDGIEDQVLMGCRLVPRRTLRG